MEVSAIDPATSKGINKKLKSNFTRRKLIKNLMVLCFSFMVSFCASDGLTVLQSTMNSKDGVGVISIALEFACGCLCALLLPKYFIKKFGSKVTIVVSMLTYVPFLASNYYPFFSLMIPTSIIVGFGSSLVWGSVGTYLNDLSLQYYNLSSDNKEQDSSKEVPKSNPSPLTKDIPINSNSIRRHKDSILITNPCKHLADLSFYTLEMQKNAKNNSFGIRNAPKPKLIGKLEEVDEETDSVDGEETKKSEVGSETSKSNNLPFPMMKKLSLKIKPKENEEKLSSIFTVANEQVNFERPNTNSVRAENSDQNNSENSQKNPSSKLLENLTARFFGIFGLIYQTCHMWSNIISYFTLHSQSVEIEYIRNSSCACGSDFCSANSLCFEHNIQIPSDKTRYILTTIYVLMSLLSALCVALFVDELCVIKNDVTFSLNFAFATCKLHKKKNQLLLVPLSFYCGMFQAFIMADYTRDFVGCAWGVNHVALVSISLGCGTSISCGLFGWLEKHLGRRLIFSVVATVNVAVFIFLLTWTPDFRKPSMMFVVAIVLGAVLGTMWCQLRAFIGIIFKDEQEAAFGSYQLWHGLGCAVCFAYSNFICTYIKICLLLIVFAIGVVGYLLVERNHSLNKDKE